MKFVPAICQTCGGELMIPKSQKEAFCTYCGNKFLLEKNLKDEVTPSIENWLNLGRDSIRTGSFQIAYTYFNKVLEVEYTNEQAWIGKAIASGYLGNFLELHKSFEEAVKNLSENDKDLILKIEENYEKILIYLYNSNFEVFRASALTLDDCHKLASYTFDWLKNSHECIENYSNETNHEPLIDLMIKASRKILKNTNYLDRNKKSHKFRVNPTSSQVFENYYSYSVNKKTEIDPMYKPPLDLCFIATATYININHPNVVFLRNFRDDYLNTTKIGLFFINLYYYVSPPVAKVIENHNSLKTISHLFLINPIIRIIKIFYKI